MKKQSRFIAWIMALIICFTNIQSVSAEELVDNDVPIVQDISANDVSGDVSENDVSEGEVAEIVLPDVSANEEVIPLAANSGTESILTVTINFEEKNSDNVIDEAQVVEIDTSDCSSESIYHYFDIVKDGYMPVSYYSVINEWNLSSLGFYETENTTGGISYLSELYLMCSDVTSQEIDVTVYYTPVAYSLEHFYVFDGEVVPAYKGSYALKAGNYVSITYHDRVAYNNRSYRQVAFYTSSASGVAIEYYELTSGYVSIKPSQNLKVYHIMSSNTSDTSTTHYRLKVYDTFLDSTGQEKEKKLRIDEMRAKSLRYSIRYLQDIDMRYYFLKSEDSYYGTPMRDVTIEFIYQERNDYGCQIVIEHKDMETGEEIAPQTILDVSGDVSINDLLAVFSADVEPYKLIPEAKSLSVGWMSDEEDVTEGDVTEQGNASAYYEFGATLEDYLAGYNWTEDGQLDVSIIYPGVHRVNIVYQYKYISKVNVTVQKEDVSGNIIGEPVTYALSEEEGKSFVDIPVDMKGHRLVSTREDADFKGVTFANVLQAEVPCVRVSCADLEKGTFNANLTLVYEQYSPSTTVTLQQKDTLGNTIREDMTYVLSEQGQTVDIPVNIDGYRLESIKQDMDYQGISFTTYMQEGKSYIRIACTELELGTYEAGVTLVYQPVDSITFYQVLGDKVTNKKIVKTIECGDLSGTYVLSDYMHSSVFDGYVFKGYASYETEEELQLAIKEDSVAYIEEIVHTDDDAREHTNVYLIYKKIEAPADKEGLWIEEIAPQYYTGKAIMPEIRVYDGTTLLQEKIDYTVSYKNNTNVSGGSKLPTVTVKGKGNYGGTEKATFEILPVSLASKDVSYVSVCSVFNNKTQKPVPVITCKGKKLKKNKDFSILYPSKADGACKEPGEYVLRVVGEGNYTGTIEVPFVIVPKEKGKTPVSKLKIGAIEDQIYTGSAIRPVVSVKKGKKDLVVGEDYTVSYWNNIEVGTGYVCVAGMGSYVGNVTIPFRIGYISVADATVSVIEDCVYNGDAQEPAFFVTLEGKTLVPDVDYVFQYKNNIDAGIARIEIEGINHYEGTLTQTFKIRGIEIQKSWVAEEDKIVVPYEKGGSKPKITMTFDGEDLVCGRDYSLTYLYSEGTGDGEDVAGGTNDGDDCSYPRIVVTGQGDYDGEFEVPFTMTKRSLSDKNVPVTIKVGNVAYNKKAGKWMSTPVLVDANGLYLEPGVDYEETFRYVTDSGQELTAKDAPDAGTKIKVIVTGKGYYTGTITGIYTVTKGSIAKAKGKIAAQEYTGSAITLDSGDFSLKIGKTELVYGKDFEVVEGSYQKNIAKGTASVKIRGLGEYGGEKTLKFKITERKFIWFWNLF